MKIRHLFIFLVLCQCKRESETRPKSLSDVLKLPKPITSDMVIILNGTIKIEENLLFVSLSDKEKNSFCNMTYDANAGKLSTLSELSEPSVIPYTVAHNSMEPTEFSLHIEPRKVNQRHLIHLSFEADNAGQLPLEQCEIRDFRNVSRIIVKGANSISSILFSFKT